MFYFAIIFKITVFSLGAYKHIPYICIVDLNEILAKLKHNIMKSQVTKIELITEKGVFTFENYSSLLDFEKNNWEQLGETSYNVFRKHEDGDTIETLHSGINASCFFIEDMECDTDE